MTVSPEGVTKSEYLPPDLSNQVDSTARESGRKTYLARHLFEDTAGLSPHRSTLTDAGYPE